ncbi:glycoside hydrolase family 3 protein [Acetobacter tropicalis NBRC 101654]|uniref:Glycoside hydrolase family 3 protein n=1 Tax=Acetobacter tropicalis NBRC 101654 TaxID=749388 RepID=F7VAC0_9PROT|nr:glycoside hydrolase family 3 C-terminal domain-containing protein [Acetobacter tropicalis]GAA07315.1 glycoside hydrolase family 3 protein [Acetobacter tropicalis NBRC 101654]
MIMKFMGQRCFWFGHIMAAAVVVLDIVHGGMACADTSSVSRIEQIISRMTLSEKLGLLDGGGRSDARCVGYTRGVKRLGVPALCMGDGPAGVGNGLTSVTIFPAPISVAATWDTALAKQYGEAQAEEQKGKGRNVALLPTVNILRTPLWGRAAETLGEDPFLSSMLGTAIVEGVQSRHVIAMPKHFAANNQETDRFGDAPAWSAVDAIVSERALREIYLPAFEAVVHAGHAQSIMCAYNRINGKYACDNTYLLGILRNEWKFDGFVTSDWLFAGRSTVASIKAGQDQLMPGGINPYGLPDYYGPPLVQALKNHQVSTAEIDGMVRHVLNGMYRVGVTDAMGDQSGANVRTPAHSALAEQIAADGIVLLRNQHHVLPLSRHDRRIAIIGPDATTEQKITEPYGGFVPEDPAHPVLSPLQAIRALAGKREVVYAAGTEGVRSLPSLPASLIKDPDAQGDGWKVTVSGNGTHADVVQRHVTDMSVTRRPQRWDGILIAPENGTYRFSIAGGGQAAITIDGQAVAAYRKEEFNTVAQGSIKLVKGQPAHISVFYDPLTAILPLKLNLGWAPPSALRAQAVAAARKADIAVVFVNDEVSEGADRTTLDLPGDQNELVTAVAAANPRTVVVMNTAGAVLMPWRDKVSGILEAWYAGEGNGEAIANVLFGLVNPSGRLPETFPADATQGVVANTSTAELPGENLKVHYDEGILVGYRYYDAHSQRSAYPFGYGLSYTNFNISNVRMENNTVSFKVKNEGKQDGKTVVQMYVSFPKVAYEAPQQLKAFQKISLKVGESKDVIFPLSPEMFKTWDDKYHKWKVVVGEFKIYIGFSSRDHLEGSKNPIVLRSYL